MALFRLGPDSFFWAGRDKGTEERVKSSMGERGGKAKMIKIQKEFFTMVDGDKQIQKEIFNNGRWCGSIQYEIKRK